MSPASIALAVAAFAIGTAEFVMIGLVPEVARDLTVTIPQAGLLVTGYALAVTVGAPTVTAQRRRLLSPMSLDCSFSNADLGLDPQHFGHSNGLRWR